MIFCGRIGILHLIVVATLFCPVTTWAQDKATPIPTEQIKALEETLAGSKTEASATRKRLAVKRMVRDAGELLQAHATAPNRFEVLAIKVAITMALELGDTQIIADLLEVIAERFSGDLDIHHAKSHRARRAPDAGIWKKQQPQ